MQKITKAKISNNALKELAIFYKNWGDRDDLFDETQILAPNIWREVFIWDYDQDDKKVSFSLYEKTARYLAPAECFITVDELDEEVETEEQYNPSNIIKHHKPGFIKKYGTFAFSLVVLLVILFNVSYNANYWNTKETQAKEMEEQKKDVIIKNQFRALTEQINNNNLKIQKQLEIQKIDRDKKRALNTNIEKSKEIVKELEKSNKLKKDDLIKLSL